MGAPAPSLRLASTRVAVDAAVVLFGNHHASAHAYVARAGGVDIPLAPIETWRPFALLSPGNERYFLLRPAGGGWPVSAAIELDVMARPPLAPGAPPIDAPSLAFSFQLASTSARATPPIAGALGAPYEQSEPALPIFGRVEALYIPHGAMRSDHAPVLWLEIDLADLGTASGAIEAGREGAVSTGRYGFLPRVTGGRVTDTAGLSAAIAA